MSAEANNLPIDDELSTTAPEDNHTAWKMPEPVFKRTSGRLPKGFEKQILPGDADEGEETLPAIPADRYTEPKPKNPTLKILVVVLALIAMVAFIIAFLTVLYFVFLR